MCESFYVLHLFNIKKKKMVHTTQDWNNDLLEDELIPDTMLEDNDEDRDGSFEGEEIEVTE